MHPINFIEAISQTGWVSESLFRANLGGGTTDLVAADQRQRLVAEVTSAVPLSDEQSTRQIGRASCRERV